MSGKFNTKIIISIVIFKSNEETSLENGNDTESGRRFQNQGNANSNPTGKSRRQNMLELEKLSQKQINDVEKTTNSTNSQHKYINSGHPNPNPNPHPNPNPNHQYNNSNGGEVAFVKSRDKSLEEMQRSLEEQATKTSTNFNIQTLNESNKPKSVGQDFSQILEFGAEEWAQKAVNNIKSIQASQIEHAENSENNRSNDVAMQIGQWGELFVFEMLKKIHEEDLAKDLIKIEWMNETKESGLPYDFRITDLTTRHEMDFDVNQNTQLYIEVKSTNKATLESFPISYKELMFSHKYSDKFEIYRLYNACSTQPSDVKVKIIKNIPNLLYSHDINLFMVIWGALLLFLLVC